MDWGGRPRQGRGFGDYTPLPGITAKRDQEAAVTRPCPVDVVGQVADLEPFGAHEVVDLPAGFGGQVDRAQPDGGAHVADGGDGHALGHGAVGGGDVEFPAVGEEAQEVLDGVDAVADPGGKVGAYGGGEHVGGGFLGEEPQAYAELGALAGDGEQFGLEAFAGLAVGVAGVVRHLVDHHEQQRQLGAEFGDAVGTAGPEQPFPALHLLADPAQDLGRLVGVDGVGDLVGGTPPGRDRTEVGVDHDQTHVPHEGGVGEEGVDGDRLTGAGEAGDQGVRGVGEVEHDGGAVLVPAEQHIIGGDELTRSAHRGAVRAEQC